ncbi:amidohydrolase [Pendulispora albinea]|uniref:Amidohydrolase family protein n=1 Tax=Pendulispora albinea TaxID=2741071 RepID=A0ABZ2M663_9BACT
MNERPYLDLASPPRMAFAALTSLFLACGVDHPSGKPSDPTLGADGRPSPAARPSDGGAKGDGRAPAQWVLRHGRIRTMREAQPFAEAVAVRDGAIVFVGANDRAGEYIGSGTRVVDLRGRYVLPGLHDVHQHTIEAHVPVVSCRLDPEVTNPEDYVRAVKRCQTAEGTSWVLGNGHEIETILAAKRPPRAILDDAIPDRPVAILDSTSHSTWVNTRALEVLGITASTRDPQGGLILREPSGKPNGLLIDAAGEWPWDRALAVNPTLARINDRALLDAMAHDNSVGITSACDARVYWERGYLDAYRRAEAKGEMSVRMVLGLWAYPLKDDDTQIGMLKGMYRDQGGMVRVSQIKIYADGLTQNTTAALLEPYLAKTLGPDRGLEYFPPARLVRYVRELQGTGFDMHIHTIGDRGVRQALDAIESVRGEPGGAAARHRLTHVELVHPRDVPRFRALGVFADMQLGAHNDPGHLNELEPYVGARRVRERAWPLRDLHAAGAPVVLSSDYDVGDLDPFMGIQRALTRGAQSLPNLDAALRAYTVNAARAMRSETRTGSIEPGKRADLIVIDRDLDATPADQIGATKVLWTLVDGREVYRRRAFDL